ncbi:class I SAM-dependent methyltransferase [Rhodopseudomonas telluris]|uniref:Class I SAM-dependent methyltransferase n=1 Tax=Rhodopseudomonas telluris TaxID=644215 RepID=A0ABV6EZI4_9BRAD
MIIPETGIPYPGPDFRKSNNRLRDDEYHRIGSSFAAAVAGSVERFDGRDRSEFKTIVDWGCGAGRVTRYLPSLFPTAYIIGVDTDAAAIQWAEDEIPLIDFHVYEHPPMPVAGGMTDLLVSHVPLIEQVSCMYDFDRVMKHGGLLVLTMEPDAISAWQRGFDLLDVTAGSAENYSTAVLRAR